MFVRRSASDDVRAAVRSYPDLAHQFKDGTKNLGNPLRVINGKALNPAIILSTGPHKLTAVFTPTNPTKFTSSTSNTVDFTF
jgi:hypothetical protein